jgi:hypothetical protein
MKRAKAYAMLACLAAVTACGSAQDQAAQTSPTDAPSVAATMPSTVADPAATAALRTFEGRDTDHDGFVSNVENAAAVAKIFDAIDTAGDGNITAQEYTAARVALGLTSLPGSEELIAQADQDDDGKLTLMEWMASEGEAFREADTDADGKLSHAEWGASARFHEANASPSAAASE